MKAPRVCESGVATLSCPVCKSTADICLSMAAWIGESLRSADEIDALKADHDAHRRQLQARNTELVEELRTAKEELAREFKKRFAAEMDLEDLADKVTKLHRDTLANIAAGKSAFTACGWCGHASGTLEEARAHVLGCEKNPPVARVAALEEAARLVLRATCIDEEHQHCPPVEALRALLSPATGGPVPPGSYLVGSQGVRGEASQHECECGCTVPGCRSCGNAPHATSAEGP